MNGKPIESKNPKSPKGLKGGKKPVWHVVLKILAWPFVVVGQFLYKHWLSYLVGRVLRDRDRVYSIRFIWYGDSVYLHPMIWGSLILYLVVRSGIFGVDANGVAMGSGWPLLIWYILLGVCFFTVMYNFDIIKMTVLVIAVIAALALAYIAIQRWAWNPFSALYDHILGLGLTVSAGFYIVSAYVFALLIVNEVIWAWLFHRIEIDESYIYERRFLQGTTREPIFARGLKRETKDLLELLILGAADIQHQTKTGYKRYKNVPGASLGLGAAMDAMLDYRRRDEVEFEHRRAAEGLEAVEHATHEEADAANDVSPDDGAHG
jgi:hypothetical protein